MLSEDDQLEAWWDSLSADQQASVLAADLDDIPGWIVASVVAASAAIASDPDTGSAQDLKSRAPHAIGQFIAGKRGD